MEVIRGKIMGERCRIVVRGSGKSHEMEWSLAWVSSLFGLVTIRWFAGGELCEETHHASKIISFSRLS